MIAEVCTGKTIGSPSPACQAVVIQGPYVKELTETCIREFRLRNSDSLIVVATYDEEGTFSPSAYESSELELGHLIFILIHEPSKTDYPSFWATNGANQNLQRLSSFIGLRFVHNLGIKFVLKIRSDTFLGRLGVLNLLQRQVETIPLLPAKDFKPAMSGRLVVGGHCTISLPWVYRTRFHIRDHFYFGHTADVLRFFDCTSQSSWRDGLGITVSNPESDMTVLWAKDLGIEAVDTRELLARYFIVHDPITVEQVRLAPRGVDGCWWAFDMKKYQERGSEYVKEVHDKFALAGFRTTTAEWLQYCRLLPEWKTDYQSFFL